MSSSEPPPRPTDADEAPEVERRLMRQRLLMVRRQLRNRGISDRRVLQAMARVPRHRFVSPAQVEQAYDDRPLPIGHGQTISQPYIVALMTELIRPGPNSRVLDVGTGCGYQAAVLAHLGATVYSVEIIPALAAEAQARLTRLGIDRVSLRTGDAFAGWPEAAPFDGIVVAAAPCHIPPTLVEQLAVGGRMVIPVGGRQQVLWLVTKQPDGRTVQTTIASVAFVPMTGEAAQWSQA